MCHLPKFEDENLLVGFDSNDDAAVYRIDDETALVQSVDIFPPVVDDPYAYGAIAAANALSDIYAMGGTPKLAMNVLCVPQDMDKAIIEKILRGGYDKVKEADAVICGGHSIKDKEPKYGLCVTGFVHPARLLANNTARPGDVLILTKPLGTGILNTAAKVDMLQPESMTALIRSMARLNRYAAEVFSQFSVSACTDITGFGLMGHCYEMASGSHVSISIDHTAIPLLPETLELASMGIIPAGAYANRNWVSCSAAIDPVVPLAYTDAFFDPQTSGGLLAAVAAEDAKACIAALNAVEPQAAIIGRVDELNGAYIHVH